MATALETYFYHNSIKTYTAAFGTLFNNLKIKRAADGKTIKVPLAYASRQKFDVAQKYERTDAHIRITWPRMAFNMVGLQRDDNRVENRMLKLREAQNATSVNTQLNRVPYIFNYELYIQTKNLDDMLQIVEQICAWFNPSLEVFIEDNPDLNETTAINIKLDNNSINDSFEGMMEDEKNLSFTFNFEVEGYIYMPTESQATIQKITLNYYDLESGEPYGIGYTIPYVQEYDGIVYTSTNYFSSNFLIKTDFDGNLLWEYGIIEGSPDLVEIDNSTGDIYCATNTELLKLDQDGNAIFYKTPFSEIPIDMKLDSQGNLFVVESGDPYDYLTKYDSNGNVSAQYQVNIYDDGDLISLHILDDNTIYVGGGMPNYEVWKFDGNCNVISRTATNVANIYELYDDGSGLYVITKENDDRIRKYSYDLNTVQWSYQANNINGFVYKDGRVFIAAQGSTDPFVAELDASTGTELWLSILTNTPSDMEIDHNNNLYILDPFGVRTFTDTGNPIGSFNYNKGTGQQDIELTPILKSEVQQPDLTLQDVIEA